ncbi:MAG: ROK family protein [Candidatus Gygaella obscura]|nr:ROK family protein [Candidatus Gygaella obscura]
MSDELYLGIDIGGTNIKIGLVTKTGRLLKKFIISTPKKRIKIIEKICLEIKALKSRFNIKALGVGMPGPVDSEKGIVRYLPNLIGWKDVRLKTMLQKKLLFPVVIDNDVNFMGLAEYNFGAAKQSRNCVCLTLGTGVGGCLIFEGKIFHGSNMSAGEIGHMPVSFKGPLCGCGARGCLEAYVGNNRIVSLAKKVFLRKVSLEELSELANKNNKKAIMVWEQIADYLSIALTSVVNLVNPDTIVIGGGVAKAGNVLLKRLRQQIRKRAMPVTSKGLKIVFAALGNDSGMVGSAYSAYLSTINK